MKFKLLKFVLMSSLFIYSGILYADINRVAIFKDMYSKALQCNAEAAFLVGSSYESGYGTYINYRLALSWYNISLIEGQQNRFKKDLIRQAKILYQKFSDIDFVVAIRDTQDIYDVVSKNC